MKIEMIGNITAGCIAATVFVFAALVLKGDIKNSIKKE